MRTQHFDSAAVTKKQNVVSLEGVGKGDGWTQAARNAIGDPSDSQDYPQTKQFEPDEVPGVSSAFKGTEADESVEGSRGSGRKSVGTKRSPEGHRDRPKKKKKFKLLCKRVSAHRCKEKQKRRTKTTKLSIHDEKCGSCAVPPPQVGGSGIHEKCPILPNDLDHDSSCSHAIGDDEPQWDIIKTTEVVNGDGEDTHIETPSSFLLNTGKRKDNRDKESADRGISTTSGLDYGDSHGEAFNDVLEKEDYVSDESSNDTSFLPENKSAGTSKLGVEGSVRS